MAFNPEGRILGDSNPVEDARDADSLDSSPKNRTNEGSSLDEKISNHTPESPIDLPRKVFLLQFLGKLQNRLDNRAADLKD